MYKVTASNSISIVKELKQITFEFEDGDIISFVYREEGSDLKVLQYIFFNNEYDLSQFARLDYILFEYQKIVN